MPAGLHVITHDRGVADDAIAAGAAVVQIRHPGATDRELHALAEAVVARAAATATQVVVNDRVDVALAVGADGVHLGAGDLPVAVARHILGPDAVVGGTAREPGAAQRLVAEGASYLGVGPTFATRSKKGLPPPLGPVRVAEVAASVDVPVVAIGGITVERVGEMRDRGLDGVAVIGAVAGAGDRRAAVRALLAALHGASRDGAGRDRSPAAGT